VLSSEPGIWDSYHAKMYPFSFLTLHNTFYKLHKNTPSNHHFLKLIFALLATNEVLQKLAVTLENAKSNALKKYGRKERPKVMISPNGINRVVTRLLQREFYVRIFLFIFFLLGTYNYPTAKRIGRSPNRLVAQNNPTTAVTAFDHLRIRLGRYII
jgi:hypothetical protein